MAAFLLGCALFLVALAVLGAVADWADPYGERADARRRNRR